MFSAVDDLDDAVQKMLVSEPCGDVERIVRIAEQVEFLKLREIAAFDRSADWQAEGFVSTAAALRAKCRMVHGVAHASIALARKLESLPVVAEAFGAGEISRHHAVAIASAYTPERATMIEGIEAELVDLARLTHSGGVREAVTRMSDAFDGDGGAGSDADQYQLNRLHISSTLGGRVRIDGSLDKESGEIVKTAVDAMQAELRRDGDKRHRSAKQADALTGMCRRSLARDHKPTSELSRRRGLPHVSYIVDLQNYEADHPDLVADIRIEAEHVGALSRATLDRIACDCEISRIIMDGPSVVIDVGRTTRNVPDKLWNALVARDRHCQAPGCDRKPAWCDAHHVWFWGDGGPTDLANLKLLCWYHHREEHIRDAIQRK
ncbi:MAG TPA: DUF222 domain-containing protein [Acidimicrobiia bacterium]|nr:DUF222 domain-containing protein [Acidimicrobiia bacterium]